MNDQEKQEIENMLLQAKLDVAETRLKMFFTLAGALLGVFGILIPLVLTINSSNQINNAIDRVDRAITKMEQSFKELAGTQLRKPDIECYIEGKPLNNVTLSFQQDESKVLELKNVGDKPASEIKLHLYISDEKGIDNYGIFYSWQYSYFNDEPEYSKLFTLSAASYLEAKESSPVEMGVRTLKGEKWATGALLKIYYGQPEPKLVPFRIQVHGRK